MILYILRKVELESKMAKQLLISQAKLERGRIDPEALHEQIHLKSNLIRCYPVPIGIGFSFVK